MLEHNGVACHLISGKQEVDEPYKPNFTNSAFVWSLL